MSEQVSSKFNLGIKSNHLCIGMPMNKSNKNICKYLFKIGLIDSYVVSFKRLIIYFSSLYEKKPILYIKKISVPSRRVYISFFELDKNYRRRRNLFILSTSKGILTNKEAIKHKIGGELLFLIQC